MENVVRTIYGAYLQSTQLLKLPFNVVENTTLNEKFGLYTDIAISPNEIPRLAYATIGNGGHRFVSGSGGVPLLKPLPHKPRDAALYNHLPFIIRPLTDDIPAAIRAGYRLRKLFDLGGEQYVAYYAKVLDLSAISVNFQLRRIIDGETTVLPFVPSLDDLSPTPPVLDSSGSFVTTGDYVSATAKVEFLLDQSDINEIISACNILYGDDNYAMISEMAVCTGIDKPVTGTFLSGSASYTDTLATQVYSFVNTLIHLPSITDNVTISFELGNVEPLLVFQPGP